MTKCDECGGGPVTTDRQAVIRYDIAGLHHVELHGVEVTRCEACGYEEIGIPRLSQLHALLAAMFVKQPRMLAPSEIRFLRKHVGLSSITLAATMGVTRETVSRWETGANAMSAPTDRLLRMIVLGHQPTDDYIVFEFLQSLEVDPPPDKLPSVAVHRSHGHGWKANDPPEPAKVG
ncbi:MAG TPA: type II TA system antitoxin MqsA family protein [Gemmatimonadaceae bacterium]|nr:type II TA system antitoxin MqsA family protein [Gemmatimonadaceae bacterium]